MSAADIPQSVYYKSSFAESPRPGQTYALIAGQPHRPQLIDHSLEDSTIDEVARTFAPKREALGLRPAKDPPAADLLIVVHRASVACTALADWTLSDIRFQRFLYRLAAAAGPLTAEVLQPWFKTRQRSVQHQSITLHDNGTAWIKGRPTAPLPASAAVGHSSEIPALREWGVNRDALFTDLDYATLDFSGEYMVVLMAYDFRLYRDTGAVDCKWVTSLSMTGRKVNFHEALTCFAAALPNTLSGPQALSTVTVRLPTETESASPPDASPLLQLSSL